jgi:dTMP kinase
VFKHDYPGRLITVSGTDGAGKSTLIQHIEDYLIGRGRRVLLTRQPTTELRKTPMFHNYIFNPESRSQISYQALLALMLSDRLQHQCNVIIPALREGSVVVSDRYIFTLIAAMCARGYEEEWVYSLIKAHIFRPDLAILLTAPIDVIIRRIRQRKYHEESYVEQSLLEAMQREYMKCAAIHDLAAFDSGAMNEQEITDAVMPIIERLLQGGQS